MTDPDWFHVVQAGSYLCTSLAAVAAAAKYNLDRNAARRALQQEGERKADELAARVKANDIADRELAWRRMEASQKMLNEMSADPGYHAATTMLDWTSRDYPIGGRRVRVTEAMMLAALRTAPLDFDDTEIHIRDSFDTFFYFLERVRHQIEIGMIDIAYVVVPLRYYACRIDENRAVFDVYLETYTFTGARDLIDRLLREPGPRPLPHRERPS